MASEGLTRIQGAALYFGAVLGTGVLVLPSLAQQIAGPASVLAWSLLIVLSVPLAATFAQLGARHPGVGGVSNFVSSAYGYLAGGIVGWIFYGGVMLGTPSAAMMGGFYLAQPFHGGMIVSTLGALGLYLSAVLVLNLGVRNTGKVQLVVTSLLVITLIAVIIAATPYARVRNLYPFAPHGWYAVGHAASLLMFAFVGWEAISPMSAEFRDPKRDIPWATAIALFVTSVLYIGLALITTLSLGDTNRKETSLAALLSLWLGQSANWIMAGVASLLTIGALLAYVGGGAKLGASLANDGFLPRRFKETEGFGRMPKNSLALITGIALLMLFAMSQNQNIFRIALYASSACFITVYIFGSVAALRLLRDSLVFSVLAWLSIFLSCILLIFSGWFILAPIMLALIATLIRRNAR